MVSTSRAKGARVYVEGAEREDLRRVAREAFSKLFSSTLGQRKPSFVFCGSRLDAYKAFVEHLKSGRTEASLLLVDAEEVVTSATRWEHLGSAQVTSGPDLVGQANATCASCRW